MKNLNILVKIAGVGVYAIFSYVIFIFYCFGNNVYEGGIHGNNPEIKPEYSEQQIKYFSFNIGNLGGTAAMGE